LTTSSCACPTWSAWCASTAGDVRTRYRAEGNGPSIYLFDPEGNQVELKGPSDGKRPPD